MGLIDLQSVASTAAYLDAPQPGARLYMYHPGTDILSQIFEDEDLTQMQANPVIADANGAFPHAYSIDGDYRLSIETDIGQSLIAEPVFAVRSAQRAVLAHVFKTVETLQSDRLRSYEATNGKTSVAPGDLLQVALGGVMYEVAAKTATDHHLETAEGLRLYVQPDSDGYYPVEAFGFVGDGSAEDRDRLQAACDATPYLKFSSKTYELGAYVPTPAGYGSHRFCCINAGNSVLWRTAGKTRLRVSASAQTGANANDITILFMEDQEQFSAPGFLFDESATGQGYGAPLAFYGVDFVDLDRVSVFNANPVRVGASSVKLSGEVTGKLRVTDSVGTFAVGGKPGGAEVWHNFEAHIKNGRGGVNLECEDVDGRSLLHQADDAVLGRIVGYNLHGDAAPVEFVKIEDGMRNATVESILLRDASSTSTGRATALSIKEGQSGTSAEQVSVGRISAYDVEQVIFVENGASPIGQIEVSTIRAGTVGQILSCRRGANGTAPISSVLIRNVQGHVQSPSAPNVGTAFEVENDTTQTGNNSFDPHLDLLRIKGGHLPSVRERTFSVRGANRVVCQNLTVDAHLAPASSGGYAGTIYNVIEADDIVLTDTVLRGFAGSGVPLELRPKRSCRLTGLEIEANGGGTALFINGSGKMILEGCHFSGATNALNFRVLDQDFDAATAVDVVSDQITLPGHTFRHGEQVKYAEGTGAIGGMTHNALYFVLYVDANTIQLSTTRRGAALPLVSQGSGTANLRKALRIRASDTHSDCTTLAANSTRPLLFSETGTW